MLSNQKISLCVIFDNWALFSFFFLCYSHTWASIHANVKIWNSRHNCRKWYDGQEKIDTLWTLEKCLTIIANLFYKCFKMQANAVANLTIVLRMKRECKTSVSTLYNTHYGCFSLPFICLNLLSFKFGRIVHIRSAFCGNVNTNTGKALRTSYDHLQMSCHH